MNYQMPLFAFHPFVYHLLLEISDNSLMWTPLTRRRVIAGAGLFGAATIAGPLRSSPATSTVLELFTSQACFVCPLADELIAELSWMQGIIAIAYHVDYWDYRGWRDTLANPVHSQRQFDYAKTRRDHEIYTPQVIVDGVSHFVGTNRQAIFSALKRSQAKGLRIPIDLDLKNRHEFLIRIGAPASDSDPKHAVAWLIAIVPSVSVFIEAGENIGRKIVYRNIVRKIEPIGVWRGSFKEIKLPIETITNGNEEIVVLLQLSGTGPIIGAAHWSSSDRRRDR